MGESIGEVAINLIIAGAIGWLVWTLTDLVKMIKSLHEFMLKHKGEHDVLKQQMEQITKSVDILSDNFSDHKEDIDQRLDHHILVIQRTNS